MLRLLLGLLFLIALRSPSALAEPAASPRSSGLRPHLALQIGHNLPVTSVAFSPNGKFLASGSRDTTIKLWDVASGGVRRTLSGTKGAVNSVAFSPDNRWLASAGTDSRISLWDVASGSLHRIFARQEFPLNAVAYSPNGRWLASGSFDGSLKIWSAATGAVVRTLAGHQRSVECVAFSPDGRWFASGSMDRTIKIWDVATGKLKRTLSEQEYMITSVAFSPDGKSVAGSTGDEKGHGIIRVWDGAKGALRRTLTGHRDLVLSIAFSSDGQQLVSCSRDSTVKIWDVDTGIVRHTEENQQAYAVAFSPDSETIASASGDKTIDLWNAESGAKTRTLSGHQNLVTSVAFSPDGQTLANGSWDQTVKLWEMKTGNLSRTLSGDESQVEWVKFSPDGQLIASGSWDKTIKLWKRSSGEMIRVLKGHDSWVTSIAFSPLGQTLASSSEDGTVRIWDVITGTAVRTLRFQSAKPEIVAFSPDGKILAGTGSDEIIRFWDSATGKLLRTWKRQEFSLTSLAFSPDGKTLAVGSADQTINLWDIAQAKVRRTLRVPKGVATSVAFSPDSRTLASVGSNEVTLWNTFTGSALRTLRGHENLVLAVTFSPDGHRLASASSDSTIKLWEPKSGRLLATMLTLPEVAEETLKARPLSIGAKPLSIGAKALSIGAKPLSIGAKAAGTGDEWFITTPEGWFDCSANAARFIRWNVGTEFVPAERYYRRLRRPDLVQQALRGEAVPTPDLTAQDVPPLAQFVRLQYDGGEEGQSGIKTLTATLEVQGRRDFKEVTVLVNGRPLPPEYEQPVQVSDVPVALTARPLSIGAKPLSIGAKALDLVARPLSVGAKPLAIGAKPLDSTGQSVSSYALAKRYVFRVELPVGASEVRLRALAYDTADIGSNPAEIVLRRPDAQPVPGNLYVLCAGIGNYKNGSDSHGDTPTKFSNLRFPDDDALAMAARLKQEGAPLYKNIELFNGAPLTNEQVTLENLRSGLKWLQQKGRPGQLDTVMVFLSGHGLSDSQGRYYFPTYDFDKQNWKNTCLSGRELQEALGGKVRARAVFLFVDTCHSGALAGARNDDLNFDVNTSGVYMMASSSSTQYSYESDKWGHGAFTLALLHSLSRAELAQDGKIHFNVLTYAVPDEIARLMSEVGQNETAMAPVVPLEGRRLDEPVAQVR